MDDKKNKKLERELKTFSGISREKEVDKSVKNVYLRLNEELDNLNNDLEGLRRKLHQKKVEILSKESFSNISNEFESLSKKYDEKRTESLDGIETHYISQSITRIEFLEKCLSSQTLLSRIANIINKRKNQDLLKEYKRKIEELENASKVYEETQKQFNDNFQKAKDFIESDIPKIQNVISDLDKESKKIQEENKKIQKENQNIKESILTISSLVFMAFTFIQLNFTAFNQSAEYTILDRLILFCGINIFLIVAIYTILSMIKSIIREDKRFDWQLKKRMCIPMLIFSLTLMGLIYLKYDHDFINYIPVKQYKEKYENKINQNDQNIKELNEKYKTLEKKLNEKNETVSS